MLEKKQPLVSFIFPIYNETGNINILWDTIRGIVSQENRYDFEFIFVNDGSKDDSIILLTRIADKDPRVKVIDFSRNFGHQIAVTAGLDYSRGDAVIVMDSDMQDPPSVSLELIEKWQEGYDVVYAQRRTRKDSPFKKFTAFAFYRILKALSDVEIPPDTGDFRLMSRQVVDELSRMNERNRFLRGMVSWIGFRQAAVQFDRDERFAGETGYPLAKMIRFATDGILSFSVVPLKLISWLGYLFSIASFVGIVYALLMRFLAPGVTLEGWTFIVICILLIGGIQMIMLGLLGSYLGRIFTESQNRPLYIVKKLIGVEGNR